MSGAESDGRIELLWVGDGAWCACDTALPRNDARRVIAFVECVNHRVEVTWVRERRPSGVYETLRDAVRDIERSATPARAARGPRVRVGVSVPDKGEFP